MSFDQDIVSYLWDWHSMIHECYPTLLLLKLIMPSGLWFPNQQSKLNYILLIFLCTLLFTWDLMNIFRLFLPFFFHWYCWRKCIKSSALWLTRVGNFQFELGFYTTCSTNLKIGKKYFFQFFKSAIFSRLSFWSFRFCPLFCKR